VGAGLIAADAVIVNVQADEPFVDAAHVRAIAEGVASAGEGPRIATGSAPLDAAEAGNPARVKVVVDAGGRALYFSRAPIPSGGPFRVHVGIYAFGAEVLAALTGLPDSGPAAALEASERLEQLRWLAAGHPIRVVPLPVGGDSVDTPEDLLRARARWRCEGN
jgi:3-deoxy-manno-octulosonate cytidylyltransferase (CMP-KDO synthetase)